MWKVLRLKFLSRAVTMLCLDTRSVDLGVRTLTHAQTLFSWGV